MSYRLLIVVALLLLPVSARSGIAAPQRLIELARAVGPSWDGNPLIIPASPWEGWPTTIEAVVADATAVVQAMLVRGKSYLDPTGNSIGTDYRILSPVIIAGEIGRASCRE